MIIVGGCARVVVSRPKWTFTKGDGAALSLLALSEGGPAPPATVMPAQAGPAAFYRPECISMRARSDARLAAP
jgi:hypothetical protein